MREIKFKAIQVLKNGRKILTYPFYINEISCDSDGYFYVDGKYGAQVYIGYETKLIQFTGLMDKNGVEIYEEDILMFPGNNTALVFYEKKYGSFMRKWLSGSAVEKGIRRPIEHLAANTNIVAEIIGNTYYNKEESE